MSTYTATGITLTARRFGDGRRLVTFYTAEHGKVEAVAAGVGKPGSSLAGAVEPFTVARLFLARGRTLDRLTQARVQEAFPDLAHDIRVFGYAAWIAELTARATEPGEPCPELFARLVESFRALTGPADPALVAAACALALLELGGLAPALDCCARCGTDLGAAACYNAAEGGLVCPECGGGEGGGVALSAGSRGLLQGLRRLPAARLHTLSTRPGEVSAVLTLLRRHLQYHLGLSLKSERFLDELEPPAGGSGVEQQHEQR